MLGLEAELFRVKSERVILVADGYACQRYSHRCSPFAVLQPLLQIFLWTKNEVQLAGGFDVVEATYGHCVRRFLEALAFARFLGDRDHRVGETVQRFLAFRFGWFNQQAFGYQQREIRRRCVVVTIEQSLGHVHSRQLNLFRLVPQRHDELVRRAPVRDREFETGLF